MLTFGLLVQLVAEIMAGDTTGIPVYVALNQPYPQIYVDGILDDSAWDNIQHTKSFYNNSPDKLFKSMLPYEKNDAKIFYDDGALYIGLYAEDDKIISSKLMRDSDVFLYDAFEVFIDPVGDGSAYLELEINPDNSIYDAWVLFDGKPVSIEDSKKFNIENLRHAVHIQKKIHSNSIKYIWTSEIVIPFSSIPVKNFTRNMSKPWRVNICRTDKDNIKRKSKLYAWSPTNSWFHVPDKFGKLFFFDEKIENKNR